MKILSDIMGNKCTLPRIKNLMLIADKYLASLRPSSQPEPNIPPTGNSMSYLTDTEGNAEDKSSWAFRPYGTPKDVSEQAKRADDVLNGCYNALFHHDDSLKLFLLNSTHILDHAMYYLEMR
jgi:hypothetical protein